MVEGRNKTRFRLTIRINKKRPENKLRFNTGVTRHTAAEKQQQCKVTEESPLQFFPIRWSVPLNRQFKKLHTCSVHNSTGYMFKQNANCASVYYYL